MENRRKRKDILLFLVLLSILAGMVFIGAEIFQIQIITVSGNHEILYNKIVSVSGITLGDNIFKLDKSLIKSRIETAQPYLEVLSIKRNYPNEVVIHVRERKAAAAIPYLSSYIMIDLNGIILDIKKDIDELNCPIIEDIYVKSFTKGKELISTDYYQVKVLYRVLKGVYNQKVQDEIYSIIMGDVNDIYMTSHKGVDIRLGQAVNIDKKLKWLASDDVIDIINSDKKGVLDISAEGQAVFHSYEE